MIRPDRPTGGEALKLLVALEGRGRTSRELAALSLKYTSRVSDLRKLGWKIKATRRPGGVFVYTLG